MNEVLKKSLFCSLFISLFINQIIVTQSVPFAFSSARNEAMGGQHSALTDQFSTLFNNPSGFRGVESDLTVAGLSAKVRRPVSTSLRPAQGGGIQDILNETGSSLIGLELTGPFVFGKIGNNMAWAVLSRTNVEIFVPDPNEDATFYAGSDLGGAYGYSFGIEFLSGDELNFGFLSKLFLRSEIRFAKPISDIMGSFNNLSALISPDSNPLDTGFGVGLDLGMKYIWRNTLHFGLSIRDIYTPLFMFRYDTMTGIVDGQSPVFMYSSLPQVYSVGIMYTPDTTLFRGLIGSIKVLLDYNDIFDFALNPEYAKHMVLHFGLGLEFTVFDIMAIRLGLYEGLPSFGAGLDLHLFKLNLAMFGREFGTQPGILPVYNLMLGIEFSY